MLHWSPRDFYRSTPAEIFDAMDAISERDAGMVDTFLWGVRKIAYYAAAPHIKNLKEKDIYPLEIDRKTRKQRLKNSKPIEVTVDGER